MTDDNVFVDEAPL